jgi:hypothetical protein
MVLARVLALVCLCCAVREVWAFTKAPNDIDPASSYASDSEELSYIPLVAYNEKKIMAANLLVLVVRF